MHQVLKTAYQFSPYMLSNFTIHPEQFTEKKTSREHWKPLIPTQLATSRYEKSYLVDSACEACRSSVLKISSVETHPLPSPASESFKPQKKSIPRLINSFPLPKEKQPLPPQNTPQSRAIPTSSLQIFTLSLHGLQLPSCHLAYTAGTVHTSLLRARTAETAMHGRSHP